MSLGATALDLRRLVVRESIRLSAAGVLVGIAATLMVVRLLSSWMVGIGSTNMGVIAGTAAALVGLAVIASLRPAVRAARTDPAIVLRAE
jgi:putative ABC transport system permease protein